MEFTCYHFVRFCIYYFFPSVEKENLWLAAFFLFYSCEWQAALLTLHFLQPVTPISSSLCSFTGCPSPQWWCHTSRTPSPWLHPGPIYEAFPQHVKLENVSPFISFCNVCDVWLLYCWTFYLMLNGWLERSSVLKCLPFYLLVSFRWFLLRQEYLQKYLYVLCFGTWDKILQAPFTCLSDARSETDWCWKTLCVLNAAAAITATTNTVEVALVIS